VPSKDAKSTLSGRALDQPKLDALDLDILEVLLENSRIPLRKLAKAVGIEEKTVARRVSRLVEKGVVTRFTVEVDYGWLGLNAVAYVGTRTKVDASIREHLTPYGSIQEKLSEFFKTQPRILTAQSTIGANEYMFLATDKDVLSLRENVNAPLEPLTSGLSTSIISKTIKSPDHKLLMKLIRDVTGIEPKRLGIRGGRRAR
jgi:DNA-binding Lrp family transcriptional regulator